VPGIGNIAMEQKVKHERSELYFRTPPNIVVSETENWGLELRTERKSPKLSKL
jgi:hypothetical protein